MHRPVGHERGRIVAVLGPTNTGKTHYAVECMLGYASGIMGFPLRLLAREIYDRVAAAKGARRVALLTGEEKIVPPRPAYWICTVESMPTGKPVDFVAIDEIQLAADRQRGHVFTDRLLRARGRYETLLLGSDTMRPLIGRLAPGAEVLNRPRFSRLAHVPPAKIARLPRRSAIVAFSAEDVYALAELVRRRRGGTAVVMGALSPRTRNAQVAMFEAGEVDYLVATDAIGMGLNMDIDHVAFAALRKFDGRSVRRLEAAEVAQIAGRAGRHMNDGSFSTLAGGEEEPLDPATIERVESHSLPPQRTLNWRNAALDFRSPARLVASLEEPSGRPELARLPAAPDLVALKALLADPAVLDAAATPGALRRLWEVCGIPDFRKLSPHDHHALLARIFRALSATDGVVPEDWIAREVTRLDDTGGDIDTLAAHISGVRIWTYVSNRPDWLRDAGHWAERTRAVEDRLSDALHERLMRRFVERRTAVLLRRLRRKEPVLVCMGENDEVVVEGRTLGRLEGLRFRPAPEAGSEDGEALAEAAGTALAGEIARRVKIFANVGYKTLDLDLAKGAHRPRLLWEGAPIADLVRGGTAYAPEVRLAEDLKLAPVQSETVRAKCAEWLKARFDDKLGPLVALDAALAANGGQEEAAFAGLARGVAFRLAERFGVLPRNAVARDLRQLDQEARRALRKYRIRIGATAVYLPVVLKPHAVELRLMLWALWTGQRDLPPLPAPGLVWIATAPGAPREFYEIVGFRPIGENEAVRLDMLERLADAVRPLGRDGARFAVTPEIMGLVGCSGDSFARAMRAIGYGHETTTLEVSPALEGETAEGGKGASAERHIFFWSPPAARGRPKSGARRKPKPSAGEGVRRERDAGKPQRPARRAPAVNDDSPFAQLKGLRDALARKGS